MRYIQELGNIRIENQAEAQKAAEEIISNNKLSAASSSANKKPANPGDAKEAAKEKEIPAAATADDPNFMCSIVALHEKYATVIAQHFSGNILFQKALKDAFASFMNLDVVSCIAHIQI